MSDKNQVEFPSKNAWRVTKEIKNSDIRGLKVSTGDDKTIADIRADFNIRMIPKVFTAPLQAVGVVTSIFARMLNTRITFDIKSDED